MDAYRRGITGTMPGTDLLDGIVALSRSLWKQKTSRQLIESTFPICVGRVADASWPRRLSGDRKVPPCKKGYFHQCKASSTLQLGTR